MIAAQNRWSHVVSVLAWRLFLLLVSEARESEPRRECIKTIKTLASCFKCIGGYLKSYQSIDCTAFLNKVFWINPLAARLLYLIVVAAAE